MVAESHLLLVIGTVSRLFFALGVKTLRTASAHPPTVKPHIHGVSTQYRCTTVAQATYIEFSNQYNFEGAFHALFHTLVLVYPLGQLFR